MPMRHLNHDQHQDLCISHPPSACTECRMSGTLMCRYKPIDLAGFLLGFLPFGTATFVGLLQGGYGWYLLGWLAYWLFFFFGWEARILCSHCPFWAEGGRVLHCHANYGVYKIWRFHPEPMRTLEKAQFMLGSAMFIGYPFVFLLLGKQYGMTLVAAAAAIGAGFTLKRHACSRCINFSCPLNSVPKTIVDAYLKLNPAMREAWEASGYRLGE